MAMHAEGLITRSGIRQKAGFHLGLDLGRSRLAKDVALEISKVITQLSADLGKLIKHEPVVALPQ